MGAVQSITMAGSAGLLVDIECHLSNNLPAIIIVGFANRAIDESKERLRGAFANSGCEMPRKRVTINLAPADIPKADSSLDLAIAVSVLRASGQIKDNYLTMCDMLIIGELGLDGGTRGVRGIIGKLLAGRTQGITRFYVPLANMAQARLVPAITCYGVASLSQLVSHLNGDTPITGEDTDAGTRPADASHDGVSKDNNDFGDIIGQEHAKRALEICAAGGHNVLLSGPPGTGKSMLAQALSSIMPPMTHEEILEVTHMHSLASHNYEQIVTRRPVRAPHHSTSHVAIIGGGSTLKPGEISLAHRGVLLLDEFPEFNRPTIEALRQPLENRHITVSRVKDSAQYPADFMLIATANPCPCGYNGSTRNCSCSPQQIARYQSKLSGPIMDRIDLHTSVHSVEHGRLLGAPGAGSDYVAIKTRIVAARALQKRRYASQRLNATMTNEDIRRYALLAPGSKSLLDAAAARLDLSARGYLRTIKVARTIADLDQSAQISPSHLTEALAYRHVKNALV